MESTSIKKYRQWIIGVVVSVLLTFATIINGWAVKIFTSQEEEKKGIIRRIEVIEKDHLTKQDLEEVNCNIIEKIDARFDKFELYFQTKYKITPK